MGGAGGWLLTCHASTQPTFLTHTPHHTTPSSLLSGVPIVPIFILGQSRALSFAGSKRLSRRLRASIGVWWGRWGLPFLPRKVAMVALVCAPIKVVQDDDPSQAVIDATFDRVAKEMKAVFDAAKGAVPGWETTQLVFGEE